MATNYVKFCSNSFVIRDMQYMGSPITISKIQNLTILIAGNNVEQIATIILITLLEKVNMVNRSMASRGLWGGGEKVE